jgi:hypothetical protein
LKKRGGFSNVISDAGAAWSDYDETLGLFEFYDAGNFRTLVRIARDSGSNDITVGYTEDNIPFDVADWLEVNPAVWTSTETPAWFSGVQYLGRLYLASKALTAPAYLEYAAGFTDTTMATSGAARTMNKPVGIELWYDRLWVYCDESVESGSYVLWSDVGGTTFDLDTNYIGIGGQGPITGIKRLGSRLIVFKYRGVFVLSGGEDPENLLQIDEVPFTEKDGCVSPRSLIEADGWIYFLGDNGFYRTDGNQVQRVSENIKTETSLVIKNRFDEVVGVHNKKQNEVCWFIPVNNEAFTGLGWGNSPWGSYFYGGGTIVNVGLAFNYELGVWSAPFSNQTFDCATVVTNEFSSTTYGDQLVIVASNVGDKKLFVWDDGALDDDEGFTGILVTPPLDMGSPSTLKIIRKAYARVSTKSGDDVPLSFQFYGYDSYDAVTFATEKATSTFTQSGGTEEVPVSAQTRTDLSFSGKNPRVKFTDVLGSDDQEGGWNLDEICFLFSVKGQRA